MKVLLVQVRMFGTEPLGVESRICLDAFPSAKRLIANVEPFSVLDRGLKDRLGLILDLFERPYPVTNYIQHAGNREIVNGSDHRCGHVPRPSPLDVVMTDRLRWYSSLDAFPKLSLLLHEECLKLGICVHGINGKLKVAKQNRHVGPTKLCHRHVVLHLAEVRKWNFCGPWLAPPLPCPRCLALENDISGGYPIEVA